MKDISKHGICVYDFANGMEREEPELGLELEMEKKIETDTEVLHSMLPFTVIGACMPKSGEKRGRHYPWGFVDCDDPMNCDLIFLRKVLLSYQQL